MRCLTIEVLLEEHDAHVRGHAVPAARAHHEHARVARRRVVAQLHRLHELEHNNIKLGREVLSYWGVE